MERENPFLFIRGPSGVPVRFGLDLKSPEFRVKVIEWIKAGGGTVDNSDQYDCRINLLEAESRCLPNKDDGDVFSANYIQDCVKENKLLNVGEYRLNRRTIFEDYDPMEIIMGKKTWSDLSRKLSAKIRSPRKSDNVVEVAVSDAEEEITFKGQPVRPLQNIEDIRKRTLYSTTSSSSSNAFRKPSEAIKAAVQEVKRERESASKVSAWLRKSQFQRNEPDKSSTMNSSTAGIAARAPFTREEEKSIIEDIVKHFGYNRLKGNEFWKEVEKRGVACKGYRSWQSMKERFRKYILPNIHISYKNLPMICDEDLKHFEKCIKGIKVERSTVTDTTAAEKDDDDEIRSNASTEIFPEDLSSIPKSPEETTREKSIKKSTPKVAEKETEENSTPKKKKRQLWSENQNDDISLLSDTRSTSKAMKRAREDYLKSPKPSTSKDNAKILFKKPLVKHQKDQFHDDDDSNSSDKSSEGQLSTVTTASQRGNPYKESEEKKILTWIIRNDRYREIKGIAMWKVLEGSNEVPDRSHQSMKERFRKHIAPNIQHYQLEEDELAKFKLYIAPPHRKGKKKK